MPAKHRPTKRGFPRAPGVTMTAPGKFRVTVSSRGGAVYLGMHPTEHDAFTVADAGRWVISKYEEKLADRLAKQHLWCNYDVAVALTEDRCKSVLGALLYDRCVAVGSDREAAEARRGAGSRNVLSRVVVVERELAQYAQRVSELEASVRTLSEQLVRVHARLFVTN